MPSLCLLCKDNTRSLHEKAIRKLKQVYLQQEVRDKFGVRKYCLCWGLGLGLGCSLGIAGKELIKATRY
jgi:hypothetical protein